MYKPELQENLKYLSTLGIVGYSDHDLLHTKTDIVPDVDPEVVTNLQNKLHNNPRRCRITEDPDDEIVSVEKTPRSRVPKGKPIEVELIHGDASDSAPEAFQIHDDAPSGSDIDQDDSQPTIIGTRGGQTSKARIVDLTNVLDDSDSNPDPDSDDGPEYITPSQSPQPATRTITAALESEKPAVSLSERDDSLIAPSKSPLQQPLDGEVASLISRVEVCKEHSDSKLGFVVTKCFCYCTPEDLIEYEKLVKEAEDFAKDGNKSEAVLLFEKALEIRNDDWLVQLRAFQLTYE
eukprot:TRINITY_DN9748_c0_g1_i2.p1 TRINITY_DN9748_c0_g1~~TRINITY_DN9748_c0_g1_i2.p1  ORF type:complete len:292 (-),score=69.39 TRINITY_DN9748_c0_g1_i2:447-1322(-)